MTAPLPLTPTQSFLIESALMLHRYGTPSHRLERVMTRVAESLDVRSEFLYTPTALVISLAESGCGEITVVRRVHSGEIDVDKLIRFDRLLGQVQDKTLSTEAARLKLETIHQGESLYSHRLYVLACAVACASVAVFFRGSLWEVTAAAMVGVLVAMIESLHQRWQWEMGLLEPVAGVAAASVSLLLARYWVPMDDRLVTLAGLIVLIPGLRLTVALTELAVGHLSAGVARLAGALVSLATLFVGVTLVWRMASDYRLPFPRPAPPDDLWRWLALVTAPVAFAIVYRARVKQWPIITLITIFGVTVSWTVEPRFGIEVAAFLGAFSVGCASNLYARRRNLPALVTQTPAMLILVPGSLGYRSMSAFLEQQTVEGVQYGFAMILIGSSLVGGLLISNAVVPPRRIL
ncbi:threonine/serine exporter family protein [Stieleria sp. TO1_6]|uniref:threonine/serine ThrE exporter family protein n=1 Tax=Stieleria tagensis TaxID=2956795 RepID=UPI00209AE989|nr:threonine/serine exporter family protein [Stieleria tagensis]MCO8124009.1 threonine/serine exporter family protein [Stieleria tagensis]